MSEDKAIRVVMWSGKTSDYDEWSKKHLAKTEYKGYCKLLLHRKDCEGFDKVPTEKEIEDIEANASNEEADEKILKLDKLITQAFMNLVLSINTTTINGRTVFRLVKIVKRASIQKGIAK